MPYCEGRASGSDCLSQSCSLRERTRRGLGIVEPCVPSPAKVPPSGAGWIH
jgi:hypothetical protein